LPKAFPGEIPAKTGKKGENNMVNFIFWATLIIYVLVSLFLARYIRNVKDYYVMGERANTLWITGSLTASYLSGVTFVGIAGIVYLNGPPIFLLVYGSWIGMVIAILYVGRRLRAFGSMTMPDYIQRRYGTSVSIVATIILIVGLLGYGLVQLMSAGVLLSAVTGTSYTTMIIAFSIALIFFCATAGMWSVVVTDTLMMITILIACFVVAPIVVGKGGGFEGITTGLMQKSPLFWSSGGAALKMPVGWSIGQFVLWSVFFPAAPWICMRAFPCRNDFVLMRSIAWSTLLATTTVTVLYLGVGATYLLNPSIKPPDQVFVWACQTQVGSFLGGMGIAGIMAAILSTAATIFIAAGFGLSRDLYERLAARDVSEKQKIFHARIAQVIVGCIVFVIALFKPLSIYWVGAWSGALFATAWMPMLVAGFEWRRVTRQGAYASMILGLGSYVLLYQMVRVWKMFKLPLNIDPIIFGIIISCVIIWIVSLLTKAKEGDLAMFDQLKTIQLSGVTMKGFPAPGALQKEIGITKKTAWAVIVISIIFFGWLIMKIVPAVS
jgi:sodium/pantothenate symporter